MQSGQLQYYLHDDFDAFRFELAGSLTGAGVESIYQAWRTALSVMMNRKVIVDITFVSQADEQGRSLLRFWGRKGARIVAKSPESRALAAAVTGDAVATTPAPSEERSLRSAIASFFKRVAFTGIRADADKPAIRGAAQAVKSGGLEELSDSPPVEPRVP